ncbi:MAG: energy transducer TonB [Candidatus Melainabacteria bacterium]|nr:energy transducer TonB [Candidatus Melainabacteria bacterium]
MRAKIAVLLIIFITCSLNAIAKPSKTEIDTQLDQWTKRIRRCWFPPKCGPYIAPRIRFEILADGTVQNIKVEVKSDHGDADKMAIEAIKSAAPFSPLPKEWGVQKVTLHGNFKIFAGKNFKYLEMD